MNIIKVTVVAYLFAQALSSSLSHTHTTPKTSNSKDGKGKSWKLIKGSDGEKLLDAVVVGVGILGLIAAKKLEENGLKVKVVEAMDHVGGHLFKKDVFLIQAVDIGGQWAVQVILPAIAHSLGVQEE
eukprot:7116748-Ditylum_brightwellii.AAC.1